MLAGVNDRYEQAVELARVLDPKVFKVNLIPYNPSGSPYDGSRPEAIEAFRAALEEHGVRVTVRLTRGRDIAAACGQLAAARPSGLRQRGSSDRSPAEYFARSVDTALKLPFTREQEWACDRNRGTTQHPRRPARTRDRPLRVRARRRSPRPRARGSAITVAPDPPRERRASATRTCSGTLTVTNANTPPDGSTTICDRRCRAVPRRLARHHADAVVQRQSTRAATAAATGPTPACSAIDERHGRRRHRVRHERSP